MLSLDQPVRDKLVMWADNGAERIIVARPRMSLLALPDGVQLEERPLQGQREIVKNQRLYNNARSVVASWTEDGLNEINVLKLACVVTGYVDFQLGNQAILCGPGYFIFIPPGMPHPDGSRNIADLKKSDSCQILYFRLLSNALFCWISHYQTKEKSRYQSGNHLLTHGHTLQLFRILMDETLSDTPAPLELSARLLQSFLRLFDREMQAERYQVFREADAAEQERLRFKETGNFTESLHQYIQSHLYERPTLEGTARVMYLSRAQFSRRVRAETGKTFVELLNEHRIETAKELLRDSDWSISKVAGFIGYRTPHYFQSLFRHKTGMTPNEYRHQSRKFETIN